MYIRPKGCGKWECVWDVRDAEGRCRRVTEVVVGTKREAAARWAERAAAVAAQTPVPAGLPGPETSLAAFLACWQAHGDAPLACTPRTRAGYAALIRRHIAPVLGVVPLNRLHPSLLADAQRRWLQQDGLSPPTVRQLYAILHGAARQAVLWDMLPANPWDRVRRPALPKAPPVTVWSPSDLAAFWRVAEADRLATLLGVLVHTGLRIGEALGLRWVDVDMTAGGLRVAQQLHDRRLPEGRLGRVKTPHGAYRWVPLGADARALLARRQAEAAADRARAGAAYRDHGLVWQTRVGTPLRARNVARRFDQLQARAGVPRITLHGLRHTRASFLIAAGADPRLVAERLGHAHVAFTLQVYGHLWPGRQDRGLVHLPSLAGPGRHGE